MIVVNDVTVDFFCIAFRLSPDKRDTHKTAEHADRASKILHGAIVLRAGPSTPTIGETVEYEYPSYSQVGLFPCTSSKENALIQMQAIV